MNRITLQFLEAQVLRLNRAISNPEIPWCREGDSLKARIGCYHLSGAYGGYALHRMENQSGGVSDVFQCGHVPKRELSIRISAMLAGIEAKTQKAAVLQARHYGFAKILRGAVLRAAVLQARRYGFAKILCALQAAGYGPRSCIAIASFLKGQGSFQAACDACDAETMEKESEVGK